MKRNALRQLGVFASLIFGLSLFSCGENPTPENPDVEPGTLGSVDEIAVAAKKVADSLDNDYSKYIIIYNEEGKTNYTDRAAYLWTSSGKTSNSTFTNITQDGYSFGYFVIYDGTTLASGIPDEVKTALDTGNNIKAIVKNPGDGWTWQTVDNELSTSLGVKHFLITSVAKSQTPGSVVSIPQAGFEPMITKASSISATTIKIDLSVSYGLEITASSSGFILKDENGAEVAIIDSVNYANQKNRNRNNATSVLLTTGARLSKDSTYYVSHSSFKPESGTKVAPIGIVKDSVFYSGDDLGLTLDGNKATFKTWAPVATEVKLLVYSSVIDVGTFNADSVKATTVGSLDDKELLGSPAQTYTMTKDESTNVWTCTIDDVSSYKYYKYQIVNNGTVYYVSDIWGKSCSADAIASQIVDINSASEAIPSSTTDTTYGTKEGYYNPFGNSGTESKAYTDAIIYEMHVTDWSYAETGDITSNVGKYLTIANGDKVIKHVKELGVTHVQILPVFEFAETNANTKYNWGYNPYHYNVPEGRYVTEGYTDGTQAVKELRELIAKFHEAGIAVNMDVVYNHTNGTGGGSLYDSTVPTYFYRFDDSGNYSNGTGCGNEIDTEAAMSKKYIIDSLKHWMLDYHFNGFRFDLMGCISKETMSEIYDALHEIDPNVLVYGEPWTGGTAAVVNGATQAVSSSTGYGAGAFDDDFRDAIKGAEFGGFKQGHVQKANSDDGIVLGLVGDSGKSKRNETGVLSLGINYVECHDNFTLFDKLAISYWQNQDSTGKREQNGTTTSGDLFNRIGETGLVEVKKEDTLAASYVMLAQGMAFMNGGQEFLRTKRGNENSYNTSNTTKSTTNGIDLSYAETYADVYNTYKGLIALRQSDTATFGGNKNAKAETVSEGVTKYTTGDYLVYFNASEKTANIDVSGYTKLVDVTSGSVTESTTLPTTVEAKSFVILKK